VEPIATLSARLAEAITSNTAAVLASTVLFQTATRVPDLSIAVQAAHDRGAAVLLDAYHGFGAFPFCINDYGVDPIFMVSGGYKYAQWGEGACWMRVPPKCTLRPVFTGWFSDFEHLASPRSNGLIGYGRTGADRFAGSTFEPTSWYRAAAVIEFFEAQRLTLPRLRALSLQQTAHIIDRLAPHFELLTPTAPERRGGFVAVRTARAGELVQTLRQRSIFVDSRADILRLGPAPYVDLGAIDVAIDHLLAVCQTPK
jgi:kynureninase